MSRINRRLLMRGGIAAGMVAVSGMVTVAAPAGTLRIAVGGRAEDWDPATWEGDAMRVAGAGGVLDCLTEIGATGELRGELATGWEVSADARVWRFDLRPGVMFHDGMPFGAEDVIATFDWLEERGLAPPGLVEAVAEGPLRLRLGLAAPDPDFALHLADPRLAIHGAGREGEGIGTGLYRLERFEPGIGAELVRVGGHYRDGEAGFFDRVEVQVVALADERAERLIAGAVDVAGDVGDRDDLRGRRGVKIVSRPGGTGFAHAAGLMGPGPVGTLSDLDSGRIAERWWFA